MGQINWTAESERWLRDIHDYITNDNSRAATRVVEAIYERVQILRQFPELGYGYDRNSALNIRILLYEHYRIAYLLKADDNIDVLGVFHGALDIDRYLV